MTSAMTLWSEQWCAPRWLVNLNSGLRPKLSHLFSVFGLSDRLIQKGKWPMSVCGWSDIMTGVSVWLTGTDSAVPSHMTTARQHPVSLCVFTVRATTCRGVNPVRYSVLLCSVSLLLCQRAKGGSIQILAGVGWSHRLYLYISSESFIIVIS